ncbi:MAG: transposase [Chloroflexi bacterium]|nr:transposase [Chloroflexota bacterium]
MPRGYRVFDQAHYAYFVTSTIVDWLPVFVSRPYFDIVVDSLKFMRTNKGVQVNAFVIMPTHLHLVLYPDENVNLSNIMRDFKRHTSQRISAELQKDNQRIFLRIFAQQAPNRTKAEYRVWQEGFHPEAIYSADFARQKIAYLHENPVRKELVNRPEHWRYSSARNYLSGDNTVIEIDLLEW